MSHPSLPHPLTRTRWGLIILASLAIFGPLSIDLYLPALPQIGRDLGVDAGMMQWTLSGFLLGFCIGMLIYGPVSDAIGRRPVILFGIALFIVASLACAFARSIELLIALRFLQAFGGGAAAVLGRAIVRDIYPRDAAARILSLVALVTAITPMMAPLVGGQLLYFWDWTAVFWLLAVYGVIAFAITWFAIPEPHPPERRSGLRLSAAMAVYGRLLTDRAAWGCVLCAGGTFAAMFAYIAGTPFVYIEHFQVSPQLYGFLFGINILSQMLFTVTNSRLVSRWPLTTLSLRAALIAFASSIPLLLAGVFGVGGLWAIVLPLLPIIGVTAMQSSNMTARIMALYPNNVGAAAAALTSACFGCGAVSSFLVSLLNDGTPTAMVVVVCLCCAIAVLGLTPVFRRTSEQTSSEQP